MITFKKLCLLLPILLLTYSTFAQKSQELGVTFSSLNNFGIVYKKQLKKETRYLRLSGANFNLSIVDVRNFSIGAGVAIGWENRKAINEKFNFIHGADVGMKFNFNEVSDDFIGVISTSFGYILGVQYRLNDNFYINLETIPKIGFSMVTNNPEPVINISGNMNSTTLGIIYSFKKKEKNKNK